MRALLIVTLLAGAASAEAPRPTLIDVGAKLRPAIMAPPYVVDSSVTGPVRSTQRAGFWSPRRRSSPSLVSTSSTPAGWNESGPR